MVAIPREMDSLEEVVKEGVKIVSQRLLEAGKNTVTEFSSLLPPLQPEGC